MAASQRTPPISKTRTFLFAMCVDSFCWVCHASKAAVGSWIICRAGIPAFSEDVVSNSRCEAEKLVGTV